jgi:hypothetical protein
MYDCLIVDPLDHCLDLDEELTPIESQLRCLAGLPAETPLVLNE